MRGSTAGDESIIVESASDVIASVNIVGRVLERRRGSARGEIRNCRLLFIGILLPGQQYIIRTKHEDLCVTSPVRSEGAVRKWRC